MIIITRRVHVIIDTGMPIAAFTNKKTAEQFLNKKIIQFPLAQWELVTLPLKRG